MLSRKLLRDSRQLQEAYIEISNYFRGHSRFSARRRTRCCYLSSTPRSFSTSSTQQASSRWNDPISGSVDVTEGFPDPPPPDVITIRKTKSDYVKPQTVPEQLDQLAVGDEQAPAQPDSKVSDATREFLRDYKRRHYLTPDVSPWSFLENFQNPPAHSNDERIPTSFYGYVTSVRPTRVVDFYEIVDPHLRLSIQVTLPKSTDQHSKHEVGLKKPPAAQTPVLVSGHIVRRQGTRGLEVEPTQGDETPKASSISGRKEPRRGKTVVVQNPAVGVIELISHLEIRAESIIPLNTMPLLPLPNNDTIIPPEKRHLQIRTNDKLRHAIRMRSKAMAESRKFLFMKGFDEIETPLLFKSTPEGAREFIVPTRTKGMAYSLPQSPQQYKQMLMASGISKYFQFAKCFRDEDMRADRQPEFTQLDLEMSFARSEDVMILVERLVLQTIWPGISADRYHPYSNQLANDPPLGMPYPPDAKLLIPQITYKSAMSQYGSDKPDLRFGSRIHRIEDWIPQALKDMLTPLEDPIVEMIRIDMEGAPVETSNQFITKFLDAASSAIYVDNPDGTPGVTVYDSKKPLDGLASFGHEGAAKVKELYSLVPGDIIILQTRPRGRFFGSSTPLGNLRRDITRALVAEGLRKLSPLPYFLWVTHFPLFSPVQADPSAPGQDGAAGICSTHHPFTAPRSDQDLTKLYTDPLSVIGDHYDLVINGVEVGGGSRRIHDAQMQESILRDVLCMKESRIREFSHLIGALRSGCPPHAGFALGFDRLMALVLERESVRDVIAFPKWGAEGRDHMVGAPAPMSPEALKTYHLRLDA